MINHKVHELWDKESSEANEIYNMASFLYNETKFQMLFSKYLYIEDGETSHFDRVLTTGHLFDSTYTKLLADDVIYTIPLIRFPDTDIRDCDAVDGYMIITIDDYQKYQDLLICKRDWRRAFQTDANDLVTFDQIHNISTKFAVFKKDGTFDTCKYIDKSMESSGAFAVEYKRNVYRCEVDGSGALTVGLCTAK